MKIYSPVRKTVWGKVASQADLERAIDKSGQRFGVDESGPACNFNPLYPCDQTLYQYKGWGPHKGIDIPCATGTEVYAPHDGICTETSDNWTQGIGVVLYDEIQQIKTVLWHLLSHSVKVGDKVRTGDLIAISDNSGYSAGSHLHFELKTTDASGTSIKHLDPLPHFVWDEDMLTKEQVRFLQALEGFHDEAGVDFWGDGTHTLDEYKVSRVPDKIKELQNI